MKMDPFTGWPFFVDHPNRRTTWLDPRYPYYQKKNHGVYPSGSFFDDHFWQGYPIRQARKTPYVPNNLHQDTNKAFDDRRTPAHSAQSPSSSPHKEEAHLENKSMDSDIGCVESDTQTTQVTTSRLLDSLESPQTTETTSQTPESNATAQPVPDNQCQNTDDRITVSEPHSSDSTQSNALQCDDISEDVQLKLKAIEEIEQKVKSFAVNVTNFQGSRQSKNYLYLDETLLSLMITLDGIKAEGNESIQIRRKAVIVLIQNLLQTLEQVATN
jgi:BCL2-associated athanogene 3